MSGAAHSVVAAAWICYSYAVSTGEFHRLPLAKNDRMLMYCGFGWKRSSCLVNTIRVFGLKALRNQSRECSTHAEILTGYLQNRSRTHR
jgi:hypothetical protein